MLFRTDDFLTYILQIIATALAIVIVIVGGAYGLFLWYTSRMTGEKYSSQEGEDINSSAVIQEIETEKNEILYEEKGIHPDENGNLKAKIQNWMSNGAPVKDDDVTNILLIGMDLETADMSQNSRADAMVIFSINHNTHQITLASILRDQYSYIPYGKGQFEKLHHACSHGGPTYQIEILEKYYKVRIDNYAVVNFYSLPKIIDALGGVEVDVTKTEAKYMNEKWTPMSAGKQKLNGAEALIYMRIRHETGGDEARVDRQQKVIKQILSQIKTYSKAKMLSLINAVAPYIRTGYTSSQIVGLATDALVNGWMNYDIKQISLPDSECSDSYTVDKIWYWKVDFPVAAQKLQFALYGKTNIELAPNRKSWIA